MTPRIRTVGLIGDVHAEYQALRVALEYLHGLDLDQLACVGDVVDGAGDVDECCRLLNDARAITVRGNHQRWLLAGSSRDLPMSQAHHHDDEVRPRQGQGPR